MGSDCLSDPQKNSSITCGFPSWFSSDCTRPRMPSAVTSRIGPTFWLARKQLFGSRTLFLKSHLNQVCRGPQVILKMSKTRGQRADSCTELVGDTLVQCPASRT